ncbi:HpcH/HpaI aldolase family protein [Streptomyces tsukubensis]|uniref:2-dehydro-3-deoxyglucarate aldolase n=1 Tax=Streptomyces tsukubensis TaxID=83656 RepID=A0A1V4AE84_9ACTN|nr:aldolase/citrate lyase family protein [Streptomyces tsukubensis]OON81865.1 2-dehydro-3-deoxyglucarate aldolase [Streptomyces tsukubensis]QFR96654.1 2-dehydro-3-deoxyglucarate aldolase [Streptomyces tsukubensis]
MSAVSLKERAAGGESLRGVLVRIPAEELIEMAGVAGLDFVLLDCEHGPSDTLELRRHVAAAQVHGMPVLVRVGEHDSRLVLRALDHGAAGVVVPHVDDAATAREAVRAARYPPRGERGFATYGRAGRYGTVSADAHRAAAENTLVFVMAESEEACREAPEILATDGVDGVWVGPADLAVSMAEEAGAPRVREAMAAAHIAAAEAGAFRMDIVGSREAADAAAADGSRFVVHNLTAELMRLLGGLAARD